MDFGLIPVLEYCSGLISAIFTEWDSSQYSCTALVLNAVIFPVLVLNSIVTAIYLLNWTYSSIRVLLLSYFQLDLLIGNQFSAFTLN